MNLQMLRALAQQYLLPKLTEMSLDELSAIKELVNELFDAAVRAKLPALDTLLPEIEAARERRADDGG
jgi:hypothetical protein